MTFNRVHTYSFKTEAGQIWNKQKTQDPENEEQHITLKGKVHFKIVITRQHLANDCTFRYYILLSLKSILSYMMCKWPFDNNGGEQVRQVVGVMLRASGEILVLKVCEQKNRLAVRIKKEGCCVRVGEKGQSMGKTSSSGKKLK